MRSLKKRRRAHPFSADTAEHFVLPDDADDLQNNSHYFSGHDIKGNSLFFRYARRGQLKTEVWFAYKDVRGRVFEGVEQLYVGEDAPARVACTETAREWSFGYWGLVVDKSSGAEVRADFAGTFRASGGIFSFGHHLDASVMADVIAREKWTRTFFAALGENDQVHYEQPGAIEGRLVLGDEAVDVSLPAVRDHSYGKRDWSYMNRHFWLMGLFEDGTSLNANMVSYPALPNLQTGYFVTQDGIACVQTAKILGDVSPGAVPDAFEYEAHLTDGRTLRVSCRKEAEMVCPFENGAYTIYEGIGAFDLGGIRGRGILEFGWNGDPSRYNAGAPV